MRLPPVSDLLYSWLHCHPGEGRRVGVMMLYSAAATGGVLTVGQAVSSALFLSRLPPSATAYLYILPAVFIVPAMLLYNQIAARRPLSQVFIGSNSLLFAAVVVFRFLLTTPYGHDFWTLVSIYLFIEFSYSLVLLQFWTFAGQIFNPREAKRLYGLIAAGGSIANIIAGLSLGALAHAVGAPNLLFVVAGALGICILSVWLLRPSLRTEGEAGRSSGTREPGLSLPQTVRDIGRSSVLRIIATLTILLALLVNIASYQYYNALQVTFGSHTEDMVAFTGHYEFWAGLAALCVQVYLTPRLMSRFGVVAALLCFPLGLGLGSAFALASGGALGAMALTRANTPVFRRTITVAALNVLYLAVPARLRQRAAGLIEILYAFSFGLLGILFLVTPRVAGWTYLAWSQLALGLVAVWLVVLLQARRSYMNALAENMRYRRLDLSAEPIDLTDPLAARLLRDTLRHSDTARVIHALQLVAGVPSLDWDGDVAPLLDHPSPEVRRLALAHLGRPGNTAYGPVAQAALSDPDESVSVAAIQAYASIGGEDAVKTLLPLLHSARPRLVGAAVVSLARYGGAEGRQGAEVALQRLLVSPDPALRLEGVQALGLLPSPTFGPLLLTLLDDPSPGIRLAAIRAAGVMRLPEAVPYLIAGLGSKRTESAAIDALAQYGPGSEPRLEDALRDTTHSVERRAAIPGVLRRLGTARSMETLLAALDERDETVRGHVYAALAQLHAATPFPFRRALVQQALTAELPAVYAWYAMRNDLSVGLDLLLDEAITRRVRRGLERIFDLLSLLYPGEALSTIRRAVGAPQGTQRAEAVELLDTLLAREDKPNLLPLLEAPAVELARLAYRQWGIPQHSLADRLTDLARGSDAWLRACAVFRIGALRLTALAPLARQALTDGDDLVRESALVACRHVLDPDTWARLAEPQARLIQYPLSRAYAQASLQHGGPAMPLSTIEKVLFLRGVELFGELESEDLALVARIATEVAIGAGERFITQGDVGDCLYILVEGETSIVVEGAGELTRRGPGGIIGEMAIISHQPRSAHCIAVTDITALRVDQDDFWRLMDEQPQLARATISVLAKRLNDTTARLPSYRATNNSALSASSA